MHGPKQCECRGQKWSPLITVLQRSTFWISFLFKDFIYSLLERVREGERKGEKHGCVIPSHTPPSGDLAYNSGMCPDWDLNWRPFGSQAGTQSTEPHQPGLNLIYLECHPPSPLPHTQTRYITLPKYVQRKRHFHFRYYSQKKKKKEFYLGTHHSLEWCWIRGWCKVGWVRFLFHLLTQMKRNLLVYDIFLLI